LDTRIFSAFVKSQPGPPMTLGSAAAASVRLIVWCWDCRHQVEPDPAEMAARYGAGTAVLEWRDRLVCSRCDSRNVDLVVSGTKRRARLADAKARKPPLQADPEELRHPRRHVEGGNVSGHVEQPEAEPGHNVADYPKC
jgi:hypothetical protein